MAHGPEMNLFEALIGRLCYCVPGGVSACAPCRDRRDSEVWPKIHYVDLGSGLPETVAWMEKAAEHDIKRATGIDDAAETWQERGYIDRLEVAKMDPLERGRVFAYIDKMGWSMHLNMDRWESADRLATRQASMSRRPL